MALFDNDAALMLKFISVEHLDWFEPSFNPVFVCFYKFNIL